MSQDGPTTRAKLARGAVYVAISRVAINLIAFISTILLARLLVPQDFGIVAIATSVTSIVFAITELSMAEALVHHPDPQPHHFDTALTLNVCRALLLAGVIAGLSLPLARIYGDPRLIGIMLALALSTAIDGWVNPRMVLFQRNLVFWQDAVVNIAQKLIGFVVAISVAYVFRSYYALVFGTLATQAGAVVVSYVFIRYRPRLTLKAWRELTSFSVWLTLARALNTFNWRSDALLIGFFVGSVQLGYYSVGDNLSGLPTREAIAPLTLTLFPAFARIAMDQTRLREAYIQANSLICAIAFPVSVGFALVARPMILLLLGAKWLPAVPMVQVLSVVVGFQTLTSSLLPLAMATGNTRAIFERDLRTFLTRFPLVILGLWLGGASGIGAVMGIIIGRGVASVLNTIWNMQLVDRIAALGKRAQFLSSGRAMLASLAMVPPVLALQAGLEPGADTGWQVTALLLQIAAGGAAYAAVSFGLWAIEGRPAGPETTALQLADRFMPGRLRRA